MKPCDYDAFPIYKQIIEPIRAAARLAGYAIAVHGSLKRDIDLVAIPWVPEALPNVELAEAVRNVIDDVLGITVASRMQMAVWTNNSYTYHPKPHGRRVWNYYFDAACHGPYLELGVMPRSQDHG